MNFEHLETIRTKVIEESLDVLVALLKDDTLDIDKRLAAAKQIDRISDTMVHAYLISNAVQTDASTKSKMLKELKDLHNHEDDER